MSVLVEALTVVVPRRVLDETYDGGTTAYLRAAADPTVGASFVCADDHLTAVSFLDYERAFEFTDVLTGNHEGDEDDPPNDGLDMAADSEAGGEECDEERDVCYVDERMGPSHHPRWLDWRREREGYIHCWLAGTEPGVLAVPEGWAPKARQPANPPMTIAERGSLMRLAVEEGREYWLDLATGRQVVRATAASSAPAPPSASRAGGSSPLKPIVEAALRTLEWRWIERAPSVLALHINGARAVYQMLIAIDEAMAQVVCYCLLPVRIPAERRAATAELLMRASFPLPLGGFELDFDDGETRYKVGIDVENGVLSPRMVQNMIAMCCATFDRFHPAIMRVAFGGVTPIEAMRKI
jgi:hypothetical protein